MHFLWLIARTIYLNLNYQKLYNYYNLKIKSQLLIIYDFPRNETLHTPHSWKICVFLLETIPVKIFVLNI